MVPLLERLPWVKIKMIKSNEMNLMGNYVLITNSQNKQPESGDMTISGSRPFRNEKKS